MQVNALLMDEKDNVVTCVSDIPCGSDVVYRKEKGAYVSLKAQEDIPSCHKVALENIEKGGDVFKYGELIGRTDRKIGKGSLVNHENIHSVPRDYDSELVEDDGVDVPEFVRTKEGLMSI